MKNLGLIYIYCAISGRIDALRRAGQMGRADGARMFLDGAFALLRDDGRWNGDFRLVCARIWLKGGERPGCDVLALGASSGREYEIRDPRGDLVFATDHPSAVRDWILEFVNAGGYAKMREEFGEDAPNYTVFTRQDHSFVSIGYIHRVALGG